MVQAYEPEDVWDVCTCMQVMQSEGMCEWVSEWESTEVPVGVMWAHHGPAASVPALSCNTVGDDQLSKHMREQELHQNIRNKQGWWQSTPTEILGKVNQTLQIEFNWTLKRPVHPFQNPVWCFCFRVHSPCWIPSLYKKTFAKKMEDIVAGDDYELSISLDVEGTGYHERRVET